jgi:hypothetical protein
MRRHWKSPALLNFFLALPGCLLILGKMDGRSPGEPCPRSFQPKNPRTTAAMKDKYCSLVRATWPALFVAAAFVLNTTAIAQAPPRSLWYNGDYNAINALANERNTLVSQAAVYDDFRVTAPQGWRVTAVFSDNYLTTVVTGADWEIRTGVSEGNGGTLVASGTTNSPVVTLIEGCFQICVYRVKVIGLNIFLPMLPSGRHYWLNVTPVGNGTGRSFNATTSGLHAVGSPPGNNQNAFFNSTQFGAYFTSTSNESQPYDYSMGAIAFSTSP